MAGERETGDFPSATDGLGQVEEIVARFQAARRRGETPALAAFLPAAGEVRRRALLTLAQRDLEYRLDAGEAARVENYLKEFPELAGDRAGVLDLLIAEHELRRRRETVDAGDYRQRFPDLADALQARLESAQPTFQSVPPPPTANDFSLPANLKAPPELRYRIIRPHARGGLGEVFIAVDQELNREVALKEIQAEHACDPLNRSRFLLEAEITGNLEHPGIVPVYGLGHYPDGRPFYAMRFIKGDNLKEAIKRYQKSPERDARQRRLELRQLLGRFVDVCNAIGYAHSRGVLHRDLKPGNIMLGKYGETLVVDWGLAKPVGSRPETAPRDESTLRVHSGDDSATQAGSAMGTPAYMSPEQAKGRHDLLGPASDIYSLGGTLYTLLTGLPPFQDADYRIVLKKVEEGMIVPPRQVRGDVPAALEAICLKAMALKPEDRYASALDLEADIEHWLADEPVRAYPEPLSARLLRWAWRHRTPVAAAGAVLLVSVIALSISTVLIGLQKSETEEARREAVEARELAEEQKDLAQANLHLAQRQKKTAEDNAAEAERQKKLAEEQKDLAQANFKMARAAVDQITEVSQLWLQGLPQMEHVRRKILEKTLAFYLDFLKDKSSDPEVRQEAGRAYLRLANIYHTLGDNKKARAAYGEAIALFKKLNQDFPANSEHLKDLSSCYNNLGVLLSRANDSKGALVAYDQALDIQKKLVEDFPERPEFQQGLGLSYVNIGVRLQALKRMDDADKAFTDGFRIAKELAAKYPDRAGYRQDLASAYQQIGIHRALTGHPDEAHSAYLQALEIRKKLVADFPTRAEFRQALASNYYILGVRLNSEGKKKEAAESYREAYKLGLRLVADFSARPDYQLELARTSSNLAFVLEKLNEPKAALDMHRQAANLYKKLLKAFPDRADYQNQLAIAQRSLAFLLRNTFKEFGEARQILEEALRHHQEAVKELPLDAKFARDLRISYEHLARTLEALKDHAALAKTVGDLAQAAKAEAVDFRLGAGYLAACVSLVDTDTALTPERRKELGQDYGGRAVKLLQQAIKMGLPNFQKLQNDPRFEPLRSRPDFKRLFATLEVRR